MTSAGKRRRLEAVAWEAPFFLTGEGDHNGPHLMFYLPIAGARSNRELKRFPPIRAFTLGVETGSDETTARTTRT